MTAKAKRDAARVLSRRRNASNRERRLLAGLQRELPQTPLGGILWFWASTDLTLAAALLGLCRTAGAPARVSVASWTITKGAARPLEESPLVESVYYLVHSSMARSRVADLEGIDPERVRLERSHAKLAAVIGSKRAFAIATSANLTRGTEAEHYVIDDHEETALAVERRIREGR